MNLKQFILFITIAKEKGFNNSKTMKDYLDFVVQKNISLDDETLWYQEINDSIPIWVS